MLDSDDVDLGYHDRFIRVQIHEFKQDLGIHDRIDIELPMQDFCQSSLSSVTHRVRRLFQNFIENVLKFLI